MTMFGRHSIRHIIVSSVVVLLQACATGDGPPSGNSSNFNNIADAIPRDEPRSRYGNMVSYEVLGKRYYVMKDSAGFAEKGIASWYGKKFHGRKTSSGEVYDMHAMTAAHKQLPLPTYVEVTNLDNGRKAIVKVNDRGPFHEGRIIDLSYSAAKKLGVVATGTASVKIRAVTRNTIQQGSAKVVAGTKSVSDPSRSSNNGKLYVQIAAFSTEANALEMLSALRNKNFSDVRIHVEKKKAKTLYKVRIGPLPSETIAERLIADLKLNNHTNAKIVSYN